MLSVLEISNCKDMRTSARIIPAGNLRRGALSS
jgi:hypothetical protein